MSIAVESELITAVNSFQAPANEIVSHAVRGTDCLIVRILIGSFAIESCAYAELNIARGCGGLEYGRSGTFDCGVCAREYGIAAAGEIDSITLAALGSFDKAAADIQACSSAEINARFFCREIAARNSYRACICVNGIVILGVVLSSNRAAVDIQLSSFLFSTTTTIVICRFCAVDGSYFKRAFG